MTPACRASSPRPPTATTSTQLSPKAQAKIGKVAAKLDGYGQASSAAGVTPAAIGFDLCRAPCDAIAITGFTGADSVASCLSCRAVAEATLATETAYGTYPDPPIVGPGTLGARLSRRRRGGAPTYKLARMNEQHKCQNLKDLGKPPTSPLLDCRVADLKGKANGARVKLSQKVPTRCQCHARRVGELRRQSSRRDRVSHRDRGGLWQRDLRRPLQPAAGRDADPGVTPTATATVPATATPSATPTATPSATATRPRTTRRRRPSARRRRSP